MPSSTGTALRAAARFSVNVWAGATHESLWPRKRVQKWGRSSPTRCHSAAKSSVSLRSIASPSGTYQIGEVNARVTDTVICVFHAPFTLTTVAKTIETVDSLQNFHRRHSPLLLKRLCKLEKSERNFPHDLQETVVSAFMLDTPSSVFYLLGNI